MQTKHPLFDDIAKLATGAAGIVQGAGEEAKAFWQSQIDRVVSNMDLVRRDEYDIALDRIASLEAQVQSLLNSNVAKKNSKENASD